MEIEGRTALLWPGYDLSLHTLALDMMHADFDLVTGLLGYPDTVQIVGTEGASDRGSAAEVMLTYPDAFARCTSSSLMPQPYGMRGGWRATFTGAVLEYAMSAGFTGQGAATLTEHTAAGERAIELPDISPYAAISTTYWPAWPTRRQSDRTRQRPASARTHPERPSPARPIRLGRLALRITRRSARFEQSCERVRTSAYRQIR
jgi:hypothetical protein